MSADFNGAQRRAIHFAKRLFQAMSIACGLGPLVPGFSPVHAQSGAQIEWEVYNRFPVYAGTKGAAFFRSYAARAEAAFKSGSTCPGAETGRAGVGDWVKEAECSLQQDKKSGWAAESIDFVAQPGGGDIVRQSADIIARVKGDGDLTQCTWTLDTVLSRCGDASVVNPFATGILTSERRPRAMFSSPRRVASGVSEPR